MSLLEIDSVNFSYGTNKILSDVYLNVSVGEVVGFLGRNGCGKSTLLKIIFGALKGEGQSIRIEGNFYAEVFKSGLVKFVPQDGLFPEFITIENAARLYESDFDMLMAYDIFSKNTNLRFNQLSGGEAKFVEMLIVLFSPCRFVLLDEPFSYISPVLVERLILSLKEISKVKGILLTDHQYESILDASDRLYLMQNQSLYVVEERQDLIDRGYIRN